MAFRATLNSRGRVLIPDRGRLPNGIWLHSGCKPLVVLANNMAGRLSQVSVHLVPSTKSAFTPPLSPSGWKDLIERLEGHARSPLPELLIMRPADDRRARLMMLPLDSRRRPVFFVKLTRNPPNTLAEQMLAAIASKSARFWYPRQQARGVMEDPAGVRWWYSIDEPMPPGPHWPARLSPAERHDLTTFISGLLPPSDPYNQSAHGDLGPWNVRRLSHDRLAVLDWENARWAPAAADEMWHSVTHRMISPTDPRRVAARTWSELAEFYDPANIRRSAAFWTNRWHEDEPEEVGAETPKSERLRAFERRLAKVFDLMSHYS